MSLFPGIYEEASVEINFNEEVCHYRCVQKDIIKNGYSEDDHWNKKKSKTCYGNRFISGLTPSHCLLSPHRCIQNSEMTYSVFAPPKDELLDNQDSYILSVINGLLDQASSLPGSQEDVASFTNCSPINWTAATSDGSTLLHFAVHCELPQVLERLAKLAGQQF
ncbi:hypothetical protein ACA910_007147 [Epithemia clementina (nom. ined.)]